MHNRSGTQRRPRDGTADEGYTLAGDLESPVTRHSSLFPFPRNGPVVQNRSGTDTRARDGTTAGTGIFGYDPPMPTATLVQLNKGFNRVFLPGTGLLWSFGNRGPYARDPI